MSIKLTRRHASPNWYLRGTVKGIVVDESTGVRSLAAAEEIRAIREAEILREVIHGPQATKTFAEAALHYMENGGDACHLIPVLQYFGETKLSQIGQAEVVAAAKKLGKKKDGTMKAPQTVNRQVYTPVSAVMNHAARLKWCPKPVFARPSQPNGRVRYLTFDEAERLIAAAAPHLRPLVIFLLHTGARLSEALYLDWQHVDLVARRVEFHNTKNGESRGVPLHERVVAALKGTAHTQGAVFRRPDGKPYESRGGKGGGQVKKAWGSMIKRAKIEDFSPHDCRHTWATWFYKSSRDSLGLMRAGGWKSERMVARYAHLNPDDLRGTIDGMTPQKGANPGEIRGAVADVIPIPLVAKGK